MLDKNKIIRELQNIVFDSFSKQEKEISILQNYFQLLIKRPLDEYKNKFNLMFLDPLDTSISFSQISSPYGILSVDGSQIYPDRHQSSMCHLINIGHVKIIYNSNTFFTEFKSQPFVFSDIATQAKAEEFIDWQRTELEFKIGFSEILKFRKNFNNIPLLVLFDGSLILWHLESKNKEIKNRFLTSYIALLEQFYREQILIASVISMPKNRDLINFINACIANNFLDSLNSDSNFSFKYTYDEDLLDLFLKPSYRSAIIGYNNAGHSIGEYPQHLRPHFLYANVNCEFIRIELPAWLVKDQQKITAVLNIIFDQCIKGHGYPVSLAEAHEQAVVKNHDREFFYQMLYKISSNQNKNLKRSRKSLKKKIVAI